MDQGLRFPARLFRWALMNSTLAKLALALLVAVNLAASAWADDFQIRDGDRVVFLGDSITEQRLYTTYIEAYTLTRFPNWKLTFRNVGWGGDTAWLRQRAHPDEKLLFAAEGARLQAMVDDSVGRGLARDVLPLRPTFVTVKFGMNDHSYQAFREDIFRAYTNSQEKIGKSLQAAGARVAYLTSQPIEDKRPDPDKDVRNQSLRRFSDGLKEVAARVNATFVDQFDPYMTLLLRERPSHPDGFVGRGDAVHPGPTGHTVMAWAVLKGLGAPALVSQAQIDGASGKVTSTTACHLENLKVDGGGVSFDRLDDALPMPIDVRAEPALKLAPVLQELNRYELQVTGLATGSYSLSIDGEVVGKASAEEIAKGWNIANACGSIQKQARQVLDLVFKKNNQYFERWRNVALYHFPDWANGAEVESKRTAELARNDKVIADFESQIETARKPKTHHFELKPTTP
jgi:lysophospholipase L1-like esterase